MAIKQKRFNPPPPGPTESNLWAERTVLVQLLPRCFARLQKLTEDGHAVRDGGGNLEKENFWSGDRLWVKPELAQKWTQTVCEDKFRSANRPIVKIVRTRTREQALNNVGENLTDDSIPDDALAKTPMEGEVEAGSKTGSKQDQKFCSTFDPVLTDLSEF